MVCHAALNKKNHRSSCSVQHDRARSLLLCLQSSSSSCQWGWFTHDHHSMFKKILMFYMACLWITLEYARAIPNKIVIFCLWVLLTTDEPLVKLCLGCKVTWIFWWSCSSIIFYLISEVMFPADTMIILYIITKVSDTMLVCTSWGLFPQIKGES